MTDDPDFSAHRFTGDAWGPCSQCQHPAHHEIHRPTDANVAALVATVQSMIGVGRPHHGLMEDHDEFEHRCDVAQESLQTLAARIEALTEERDARGDAAVREARRCDDFRKRWEEREREWAVEHDRALRAEAERDEYKTRYDALLKSAFVLRERWDKETDRAILAEKRAIRAEDNLANVRIDGITMDEINEIRREVAEFRLHGGNLNTVERLVKAEAERDSLALALEAEKHNHEKNNAYLIAERDEKQREINAWRELNYPYQLKEMHAELARYEATFRDLAVDSDERIRRIARRALAEEDQVYPKEYMD